MACLCGTDCPRSFRSILGILKCSIILAHSFAPVSASSTYRLCSLLIELAYIYTPVTQAEIVAPVGNWLPTTIWYRKKNFPSVCCRQLEPWSRSLKSESSRFRVHQWPPDSLLSLEKIYISQVVGKWLLEVGRWNCLLSLFVYSAWWTKLQIATVVHSLSEDAYLSANTCQLLVKW